MTSYYDWHDKPAYSIEHGVKAQDAYCKGTNTPHFAPYDGRCHRCGNNIYTLRALNNHKSGISVKRAATELVTGCPHCFCSYCD